MTRTFNAALAIALALALLDGAASAQTIKIGVNEPLTGAFAASGNPYVFRISPPSAVEAAAFKGIVDKLGLKKVDFLVINNDWGRGTAEDFGKMMKDKGIAIGLVETMDQSAQDMSAQLAKIKASDSETVILTTAVDQLTLIFKHPAAIALNKRTPTTPRSHTPPHLTAPP